MIKKLKSYVQNNIYYAKGTFMTKFTEAKQEPTFMDLQNKLDYTFISDKTKVSS